MTAVLFMSQAHMVVASSAQRIPGGPEGDEEAIYYEVQDREQDGTPIDTFNHWGAPLLNLICLWSLSHVHSR